MKILGIRFASVFAAGLIGAVTLAHPGTLQAQANATIHGKVVNPAGMPLSNGDVKLTTDKGQGANKKYDYDFPIGPDGTYNGKDVKPGSYLAVAFQGNNSVDFQVVDLKAGDDKTADFDMSRKEYLDKLSPEERQKIEEYKKQAGAATAANAKIANLNNLLKQARADTQSGNFEAAVKSMTDATTQKPDEPILWETLGDAQLGQANAAAKAAQANHTTDASLNDKYAAAATSYQKAIDLNSKAAKPNPEITAAAENQLGQVFGKQGKPKDAGAAYDAAAKADPTKAGTYYFNEAATLFNASDMDDAAAAADKAIAADPNKVDAYYIKGQALIQKATVDPKTNKITAPPDCVAAYQKYLELAPTGPHAEEIKGILAGIGESVSSSYKAPKKK